MRDALAGLEYEWVGAILVGGTEKLRPGGDYGVPLIDGFGDAELVDDVQQRTRLGLRETQSARVDLTERSSRT